MISDQEYSIIDLIPLDKLQKFQDSYTAACRVASTLTDTNGVPITIPSNHCGVCSMIRATDKGLRNCMLSGRILGDKARKLRHPVLQKCYSIGFTDAAAPIVVNGRHIANWLIGQYDVGDTDDRRVHEYAVEIGADPEEMVREFQKMRKLSRDEFKDKLDFLGLMANELSMMGFQNLVQKQQAEELNRINAQLEQYQGHLERKVAERTTELEDANKQLQIEILRKTRMQRRQDRLITAIESAAEAIVITQPNGKIIYANPTFEHLTGYSLYEAIGRTPRILKSGYHDEAFYRNLWQTIASGKVWEGLLTNRKKDGTIYREMTTISPVMDAKGQILNYVAVKKDVTKELALEEQLKQAQRLESIGTLAAGIAHEINTPIQYVLANTRFFREAFDDLTAMLQCCQKLAAAAAATGAFPEQLAAIDNMAENLDLEYLQEETDKAFEQTMAGIDRIATIIRAMKDFADPGSDRKEPEDLNAIIATTVTVSRSAWRDHAKIDLQLDHALPPVPMLASKIKQVLLDMIINATHAVADKYGSAVQPQGVQGRIAISTRAASDHVLLRIADNGIGIPKEIIGRIFDPFFTTKPVGRGSGQGLSAAHGIIVDHHGGSLSVDSQPGEGAVFTVTLPLAG